MAGTPSNSALDCMSLACSFGMPGRIHISVLRLDNLDSTFWMQFEANIFSRIRFRTFTAPTEKAINSV
jgi:hypothetical protein